MTTLDRFAKLGIENAPGQQQTRDAVPVLVDFSHGDVDAFPPPPGTVEAFTAAFRAGAGRAYSPYRGHGDLLESTAAKIAGFTGAPVDPGDGLMITPGTQAGLFLALAALVEAGDKVVIVEPDYFANRKIVNFLGGDILPVPLDFTDPSRPGRIDLDQLDEAARRGAGVLVLSNPNNPTGVVYSGDHLGEITAIAEKYGMFVVVDQLYSRLIHPGNTFVHLRSNGISADRCLTLLGPSKTESLSGFRTGVAVGPPVVLKRMEQVLAIHSLRTAGYNQAVLEVWFDEPDGWLDRRIADHHEIMRELVSMFGDLGGGGVRPTEGGSYLFPELPPLAIPVAELVDRLRVDHGVVVTPGTEFGPRLRNNIRLNFSQDRRRAVQAATIIADLVREQRLR
ncbi:pyridoxal phosphate-dependent aminotransferase [Amycolatopsis thermoflava]|uniref:pyridoxal phosphate-dependent aminotransferase n=1 Tax=Amycolatopsis thermoflava TaxID=84480 RepID=UPI00366561CB